MGTRVLAGLVLCMMVGAACAGDNPDGTATGDRGGASVAAARETAVTIALEPAVADEAEGSAEERAAEARAERAAREAEKRAATAERARVEAEIEALGLMAVDAGDEGDEVLALQNRLIELGFGPGSADGEYGRRTEASVAAFQGLMNLATTGRVDRPTIEALAGFTYDGLVLHAGDEGDDVVALQEMIATGPFDPGEADGTYGASTVKAVWAMEKLAGIPVDGNWGPLDQLAWERLQGGGLGRATFDHDRRWVEVNLAEQLMKIYDPGSRTPVLISHISSGSGVPWTQGPHRGNSVTPVGDFHIDRRISGWRESSLGIGRLYNPLYFRGGIAFHGATSVPTYPASHGCVRVPMHIAEYLPDELPDGTPVHVFTDQSIELTEVAEPAGVSPAVPL